MIQKKLSFLEKSYLFSCYRKEKDQNLFFIKNIYEEQACGIVDTEGENSIQHSMKKSWMLTDEYTKEKRFENKSSENSSCESIKNSKPVQEDNSDKLEPKDSSEKTYRFLNMQYKGLYHTADDLSNDIDKKNDTEERILVGSIVVSPFIFRELDELCYQRNQLLNHKLFVVNYHTKGLWGRYRLLSFYNAIETIDDRVRNLKERIILLQQEYKDKINQIKLKYEIYKNNNTPHHAQNCIEQAQKLCSSYRELIKDCSMLIVSLLSEELLIIKKMNFAVDALKDNKYFLIRNYYNLVYQKKGYTNSSEESISYIYSDKNINLLYDGQIDLDHTMKCEKVESMLKAFMDGTNVILSVKFW